MSIAENIAAVQQQIADSCRRAGRDASKARLMAVSKMHSAVAFAEARRAGVELFGENRVQEFQAKTLELLLLGIDTELSDRPDSPSVDDAISGPAEAVEAPLPLPAATRSPQSPEASPEREFLAAEVHLIGPLQSNKTAKAADLFRSIDTVDSLRLAARLNDAAASLGKKLRILLEIKLSHEESKHGLLPGSRDIGALLEKLPDLPHLRMNGLMAVPPFFDDPEQARPYFRQLRELRDQLAAAHPRLDFAELSMGMSNDFAVAIEEGSTCVRIGTAIFGKRAHSG